MDDGIANRIALFISVSATLFLITTCVGTVSALTWQTQIIGGGKVAGYYPSLALDNAGNPHISYCSYWNTDHYNGDLIYSVYDGSAWHDCTVDSIGSEVGAHRIVGEYTSLALDDSGNPRISYYDHYRGALKFASYNGSAWQIEIVDDVGNVGLHTSLALDSADKPHISYYDSSNSALKYAEYDGSVWHTSTVEDDASGAIGWGGTSLALDSTGLPRISYYYNSFATQGLLKYAAYDGSTWHIETVDPVREPGEGLSLAVDSAGNPHISYNDQIYYDLKYATRTNSAWDIQIVDSAGNVGMGPSLALDSSGKPRISYLQRTNYDLKYAAYSGTTWQTEVVCKPGISSGGYTTLALDSADGPRIGYLDDRYYDLFLARADLPPRILGTVPGSSDLPTDTDSDAKYDDVNGNGRKDFADVVLYFNQMGWISANEPVALFDYTGNGRIDFADVVWLFNHL